MVVMAVVAAMVVMARSVVMLAMRLMAGMRMPMRITVMMATAVTFCFFGCKHNNGFHMPSFTHSSSRQPCNGGICRGTRLP